MCRSGRIERWWGVSWWTDFSWTIIHGKAPIAAVLVPECPKRMHSDQDLFWDNWTWEAMWLCIHSLPSSSAMSLHRFKKRHLTALGSLLIPEERANRTFSRFRWYPRHRDDEKLLWDQQGKRLAKERDPGQGATHIESNGENQLSSEEGRFLREWTGWGCRVNLRRWRLCDTSQG